MHPNKTLNLWRKKMNNKPIIDKNVNLAQGKIIETDENRKLREKICHERIAEVLKKFDCKFVVIADPQIVVQANPKKMS